TLISSNSASCVAEDFCCADATFVLSIPYCNTLRFLTSARLLSPTIAPRWAFTVLALRISSVFRDGSARSGAKTTCQSPFFFCSAARVLYFHWPCSELHMWSSVAWPRFPSVCTSSTVTLCGLVPIWATSSSHRSWACVDDRPAKSTDVTSPDDRPSAKFSASSLAARSGPSQNQSPPPMRAATGTPNRDGVG